MNTPLAVLRAAMVLFALFAAACSSDSNGRPAGKVQRELDLNGPDIGINVERLAASARIVTNATVSQAEVDQGCAAERTGRTLIRFDIETPNHGPSDLDVGSVSCQSTRTEAVCQQGGQGIECSSNPECCCGGTYACETSGESDLGEFFEFDCSHGHIHFSSFAEYRLLTPEGEVAAAGHKQSFCLMDLAAIPGRSCAFQYTCGNQGISAGCADIYGSSLPCSFIDVTDVVDGDYVIEVTMDPLDAIDESNESNNVGLADVTLDVGNNPPPPPPPTAQRFLVRDGFGDVDEAHNYYHSLAPDQHVHPGQYSLADFIIESMGDESERIGAQYRNRNELGFWRDMTCTPTIGRASGGCFVSNRNDPADAEVLGTVAMRIDGAGHTQFFAFDGIGLLTASAVLDDEGPKFLPRLCTNCHGGEYNGVDSDLGSVWREFEPALLLRHPDDSEAQAEQNWFQLNQAIRSANQAVRSEAEGGHFGVDRFKANQERYVQEMYPNGVAPAIHVEDRGHMPATWQGDDVREELWSQTVNVYCMSCHRVNQFDFTNYQTFSGLALPSNGSTLLRRYIDVDPNDPNRVNLAFMPQSQVQWTNLHNDAESLIAIDTWLGGENNRAPEADAGSDVVANPGSVVALSASGSRDPDDNPLTFQWEVTSGPAVEFSPSPLAEAVTFVAPETDVPIEIVVQLRVTDSHLDFDEDTVLVTVAPVGERYALDSTDTPLAIPDASGGPGEAVSEILAPLDLLITEALVSVEIAHTWSGDLQIELEDPSGARRLLRARQGGSADDVRETYNVGALVGASTAGAWRLHVSDHAGQDIGEIESWTLDFGVTARPDNMPPDAVVDGPRRVIGGALVTLTAADSSDPDGDTLAFEWRQTEGPSVQLQPDGAFVTFATPVVATNTDLSFEVTVDDGRGGTDQALLTVTAEPEAGGVIRVDAVDVPRAIPDNDPEGIVSTIDVIQDAAIVEMQVAVTIDHTYIGDLRVSLEGPGGINVLLHAREGGSGDNIHRSYAIADAVDHRSGGQWNLRVSDNEGLDLGVLQAWSVEFRTSDDPPPQNQPPLAVATPSSQTVAPASTVALSATQSEDPEGQELRFTWTVISGPEITFSPDDNAAEVAFVAPEVDEDTTIVIGLTAEDTEGAVDETMVDVTISATGITVEATDTPLGIPDNSSAGVTSRVIVDADRTIDTMFVTVEIDHPNRGDLRVRARAPNGASANLFNRREQGENLHQTFELPQAAGLRTAGTWELIVSDLAGGDVGTLRRVEMDFRLSD